MLKIRLTYLIESPLHRSVRIYYERSLLNHRRHCIYLYILAIHMIAIQKVHITLRWRKSDRPSPFYSKQTTMPSVYED